MQKFIWRNIITRFGIPHAIIFDNGRQFDTSKLTDYLSNLGCQARFTTVAYPQTNGQTEAANKSILHEGLNNAALHEALDLLPSIHDDALIREALYKLHIARLHNRAVGCSQLKWVISFFDERRL